MYKQAHINMIIIFTLMLFGIWAYDVEHPLINPNFMEPTIGFGDNLKLKEIQKAMVIYTLEN